jgi:death-on-curing protein
MRHLSLGEVASLHLRIIDQTGGARGLRDLAALESALAQPKATFEGRDLYPTLSEKAAALCFSLAQNHPFLDGNKRVAHAAMETFLLLNGQVLDADVQEQEQLMLGVASGTVNREALVEWIRNHSDARR